MPDKHGRPLAKLHTLRDKGFPPLCMVCTGSPQIESTAGLAKLKVRDNVAHFPGNVSDVFHKGVAFLQ